MKTITQHMQLNKQQRQAHIDLSTPCISQTGKSLSGGSKQAKKALLKYHNIEDFNVRKIHSCHLCANNSKAPNGFVCKNPLHIYFGSASENIMDKTPAQRKSAGPKKGSEAAKIGTRAGVKSALKNGNHVSQQHITCPHCGKEGGQLPMKRWHFDNCKHKVR
tara:strand:- start:4 stop:489 length:486 start_codon:yes stop_codon:yes gene_type:complete